MMISLDDYFYYVDDAIEEMIAIVTDLGDELANSSLDLPGSNSPYAILTHCLGVMEFWGGHVVAGRVIERDRAAEFLSAGPVAELVARTRVALDRLRADTTDIEPASAPRGEVWGKDRELPLGRSQGGTLAHIYEELAQHRGQMEITRDVLKAGTASRARD
jgi:Protein of unknown function (DUF664)